MRFLFLLSSLLVFLFLVSACMTDAAKTCYEYSNPVDPAPADCTDDSTATTPTLSISFVSPTSDLVILANTGLYDADLTGWLLSNTTTALVTDIFTLPAFTLPTGRFVRIHSLVGTDDVDDLYWDGGEHWGPADAAQLEDAAGAIMDICSNSEPCWGQ